MIPRTQKTRVLGCIGALFALVSCNTPPSEELAAGRPVEPIGSATLAVSQCVTVQRGVQGDAVDTFLNSAMPDDGYEGGYLAVYTGGTSAGEKRALLRFDIDFLPPAATVDSATLTLYQTYKSTGSTVRVHRITDPWSEATSSWNTSADAFDAQVEGTLAASSGFGSRSLDLTALAQRWVDGDVPNYGVLLEEDPTDRTSWRSSETTEASERPLLTVCWTDASGLKSIQAGGNHTCVLRNDGLVRCFGKAVYGQLGYGNTNDIGDDEAPAAAGDVPILEEAVQITTGDHHTCALLHGGLVRCWGLNTWGQLGYGSTENVGDDESILSFGYVNLGGVATKIDAGANHTCALMDTGKVRCWGRNDWGQLGYGHTSSIGDNEAPFTAGDVDLGFGVTVTDIAAGGVHTCALLTNGDVKCWGAGGGGRLGYGNSVTIGDNELPSAVGAVNIGGPVVQLVAGAQHNCALLSTGGLRCWGGNGDGQLGYGGTSSIGEHETPASAGDVPLGGLASQVTAGQGHTCATLTNGQLKCWGRNDKGQLGLGDTVDHYPPGAALDLDGNTASQISAGVYHTCALLTNGEAWCWGLGDSGRLGYGNTSSVGDGSHPLGGNINVWSP